MKNYSKEQADAAFKALPSVLRDAILAPQVSTALANISAKHKLHLDKADILGKSAILVLLGIMPMNEFRETVRTDLGVEKGDADAIVGAVSVEVFEPIRKASQSAMHELGDDSAVPEVEAGNTDSRTPLETGEESAETQKSSAPRPVDPYREPID